MQSLFRENRTYLLNWQAQNGLIIYSDSEGTCPKAQFLAYPYVVRNSCSVAISSEISSRCLLQLFRRSQQASGGKWNLPNEREISYSVSSEMAENDDL